METSLRVPSGDAVQRVYAVADHGGLTVFEVENRSPLPFALAVSRADLLASRPPSPVAVVDSPAPAGAVFYPVAHRTTLRLALAHDGRPAGALPSPAPSPAEQVARGWRAFADRSGRIEVPDEALFESVVAARCALALDALPDPGDDPAGFLLAVAEGDGGGASVPVEHVAAAAERLARRHRRARSVPWDVPPALSAAAAVLRGFGEERAASDVVAAFARLAPVQELGWSGVELAGARLLAHIYGRLVQPRDGGADLLPLFPRDWYGQSVEAHNLCVPAGTVGVAVRWHGARPALLWECSAPMRLTAATLDPSWSVDATTAGEALLAPPP